RSRLNVTPPAAGTKAEAALRPRRRASRPRVTDTDEARRGRLLAVGRADLALVADRRRAEVRRRYAPVGHLHAAQGDELRPEQGRLSVHLRRRMGRAQSVGILLWLSAAGRIRLLRVRVVGAQEERGWLQRGAVPRLRRMVVAAALELRDGRVHQDQ